MVQFFISFAERDTSNESMQTWECGWLSHILCCQRWTLGCHEAMWWRWVAFIFNPFSIIPENYHLFSHLPMYRVRTGLKSTWIYRTVLKSPWKLNLPWKALKNTQRPWKVLEFYHLQEDSILFWGLNQYKIVLPLFGAAYAEPNKGTTILY